MLTRLFSLCPIILSVLSQQVTFRNVEIEYQTEFHEVYSVEIKSAESLKDTLPVVEISRITVIGNSTVPVIYSDAVSDLQHLKILQIRQHGIEEIQPGAFRNVPLLEIVRFNANKLKEIKNGVFNNLNLVFLSLDQNSISKISPQAFDDLPKLQVLDLSVNQLKHFRYEWVQNKPALTSVSLTYNEIHELQDDALRDYHNDVDFSNNRIANVSNGIFGSGNKKIGQLWLSDNYVEKWDESFVRDVQVGVLDVSRNKLECLDGDFVHFFVAFKTRLDGNPWKCECLAKMAEWVTQKHVNVKMTRSAKNCNITSL